MTKNYGLTSYLLGVASYFSVFAIFMVALSVFAPAHADTISDKVVYENAAYATYTPSMAARGQRFYVGP